MKIIVLAAGQGTRLRPLTDEIPKCMVSVNGMSILDRQLKVFRDGGIEDKDIVVVCGYKNSVLRERYQDTGILFIENAEYTNTNMVYSLMCAESVMKNEDEIIISYGDIIYSNEILEKAVNSNYDYSIIVDKLWLEYWNERFENPMEDAESLMMDEKGCITDIGQKGKRIEQIQAQYIGLMKFKKRALGRIVELYRHDIIRYNPNYRKMYLTDLIQLLINCGEEIKGIKIERGWFEIDSYDDLSLAEKYLKKRNL